MDLPEDFKIYRNADYLSRVCLDNENDLPILQFVYGESGAVTHPLDYVFASLEFMNFQINRLFIAPVNRRIVELQVWNPTKFTDRFLRRKQTFYSYFPSLFYIRDHFYGRLDESFNACNHDVPADNIDQEGNNFITDVVMAEKVNYWSFSEHKKKFSVGWHLNGGKSKPRGLWKIKPIPVITTVDKLPRLTEFEIERLRVKWNLRPVFDEPQPFEEQYLEVSHPKIREVAPFRGEYSHELPNDNFYLIRYTDSFTTKPIVADWSKIRPWHLKIVYDLYKEKLRRIDEVKFRNVVVDERIKQIKIDKSEFFLYKVDRLLAWPNKWFYMLYMMPDWYKSEGPRTLRRWREYTSKFSDYRRRHEPKVAICRSVKSKQILLRRRVLYQLKIAKKPIKKFKQ